MEGRGIGKLGEMVKGLSKVKEKHLTHTCNNMVITRDKGGGER